MFLDNQELIEAETDIGSMLDGWLERLKSGQLESADHELLKKYRRVGKLHFDYLKLIGKGNFGSVYLTRKRSSGDLYAMKVLRKSKSQNQQARIERNILGTVCSPFIVKLHFAFETKDSLCFVLDYVGGGDLYFRLQKNGR